MIPPAAFDFLRGLAANNERGWFEANRATYDSAVREPVAALIDSVTSELTRRGLPLEGDRKRSSYRIHRDVRFSKNKLPYKTAVGTVWFRQGASKSSPGVLYFHLDPAGCFAAAAFYMPDPEILDSIRERMRVQPERWRVTVAALEASGLAVADAERLSRMPKGFEDLKRTDLDPALRLKHIITRQSLPERIVLGRTLPARIVDFAERALPLLRFGWAAVDEVARV